MFHGFHNGFHKPSRRLFFLHRQVTSSQPMNDAFSRNDETLERGFQFQVDDFISSFASC